MDYIAFIAGLPEIDWDDRKLSLTVAEFREQLKDYISGGNRNPMGRCLLFIR